MMWIEEAKERMVSQWRQAIVFRFGWRLVYMCRYEFVETCGPLQEPVN